MIVHPVRYALDYYRKLNEAVKDEQRQQRKSVVTLEAASSTIASPNSPGVGNSLQAHLEARVFHQVGLYSLDFLIWLEMYISILSISLWSERENE